MAQNIEINIKGDTGQYEAVYPKTIAENIINLDENLNGKYLPISGGIPSGCIVMWSGASNLIPSGWALCNGSNGTPDLRGKFILGSNDTYAVGSTGGEETVTLTKSQIPSHTHKISVTYDGEDFTGSGLNALSYGKTSPSSSNYTGANIGGGQPHNNMPPYYALCFIMKL